MAISEGDFVYRIPVPKPEAGVDVSYLTPKQIGMYRLRAMGFKEREIAVELGKAYSTVKNEMHWISGGYNQMEIIAALMDNGDINRSEIAEDLRFERYDKLTRERKQTLEQVAERESWGQTGEEIARSMGISPKAFKHSMEVAYQTLGVNSMLRVRVFMLLKAQHDAELHDLPQAPVVLPTEERVVRIEDHAALHERRKLALVRVG